MSNTPPPLVSKSSLFDRMGGPPLPSALASRLSPTVSTSFPSSTTLGFPTPASNASTHVFAVPVSKKPKTDDTCARPSANSIPLADLLERARAATERQQLDLADHYFAMATAQYAGRISKESALDHASVLLLLGESKRAATLAASLADPLQLSSSIFERAVYIQGAALLAAEDFAGSKEVNL
jgi:hypothetical protein